MTKLRIFIVLPFILALCTATAQSTKEGIYEYDRENYQSAISIFRKTITSDPSNAENYFYLGLSLLATDKDDSAAMAFNAGIAVSPKDPYCYVGLGQYYLNINKTADAITNFEKAKAYAARKDTKVLCAIAEAYTHSDNPNYAEAQNVLAKADEINSKSPENYYAKGDLAYAKNDGGPAVSNYTDAIEGKYKIAHDYTYIGVIWKQALKYNESLDAFQGAIKDDPNFAPAYRELAELYYRSKKYDDAKTTFQKYLQLADKNDDTRYRYAQFLYLSKDYATCITVLQDLMTRRTNNPFMFRLMAYSSFETGDTANAKKYIMATLDKVPAKKLIALDYDYAAKIWQKYGSDSLMEMYYGLEIGLDSTKRVDLYGEMGKYFYDGKKYPRAAVAYMNKVKYSPTPDVADVFREGLAYYFSKQFVNADSAFTQSARISPKWVQPLTWMGRSRNALDTGAFSGDAVEAYKKVIDVSGGDSIKYKKDLTEAYKYMAYYHCYVKHDSKEASAALKRVLNIDPENKEAQDLAKDLNCVEPKPTPGGNAPVKKTDKKEPVPTSKTPDKKSPGK